MGLDRAGRWWRDCLVVGLVTTAMTVVIAGPASAEPGPGTITAVFTDICGFVQADFTDVDPIAGQIRYSRNGVPLDLWSGFVPGGGTATLYQVAVSGDDIGFEWDVAGGGTEAVDHVHATPPGCDEPNLSVSLIDSCGPEFTVAIANTGSAPADVVLTAPTLVLAPITVPVGGTKVTVPGAAGSSAWVARYRPGGTDPNADLALVGVAIRGMECGIPWPDTATAFFTPGSGRVTIVFFAVHMKGLVTVYRNGKAAMSATVSGDIHKWIVAAACGDVITIEKPPLATYVHKPPGCPVAAAVVPRSSHAAAKGTAKPSAAPIAALSHTPELVASADAPIPLTPAASPYAPAASSSLRFTAFWVSIAVMLLAIISSCGLFLFAALRRRKQPVWAVAVAGFSTRPAIHDTGLVPSMSVRWMTRSSPGTYATWEDT
jgi:hypothetical protein